MGYLHIPNAYKDQTVLMFRECYAMEKIHGTSAHVAFRDGNVTFSSGGAKHETFVAVVDRPDLKDAFVQIGHADITIYGEAYGGKQQKQAHRYGPVLKFVAFDVLVRHPDGATFWLTVPDAHDVCTRLGFEFVHYVRISTDLASIDAERDAPSEQARRNGVVGDQTREGVVLRPLLEFSRNGERVICKHKRDEERETASPRVVDDPAKLLVLRDAQSIATEWVTDTRLQHVLDKLDGGPDLNVDATPRVIAAMTEDVFREGAGEIVDSREARRAVGSATARLFKAWVVAKFRGEDQA